MPDGDKLTHALAWAARGFRVFPLAANSKKPIWEGWTELASSDPHEIWRMWHTESPGGPIRQDYNIGVLTTGWLITDLDIKAEKEGITNFLELDGDFDTLTVRTPSNGMHLYYKPPYEVSGSISDIAPGIDVRGYHNYVLAPGSEIDGKSYRLECDVPPADAPLPILLRCKRPGERLRETVPSLLAQLDTDIAVQMSIEFLSTARSAQTGLGHNNAVFMVAAECRDRGLSERKTVELMMEHWNPRCFPPLPQDELGGIVANAYAYAHNPVGMKHPAAFFSHVHIDSPFELPPLPEHVVNAALLGPMEWGNAIPLNMLLPRPWLLRPMLLLQETTAVFAPGGVGKSLLAITVAVHLAAGSQTIFGMKNVYAGQPKKSVIYNAEDDRAEMTRRLIATCYELQIDPKDVIPHIILISGKERRFCFVVKDEHNRAALDRAAYEEFVAKCSDPECVFTVLDPLVKTHRIPESDNTDMTFVMDAINAIATNANVALLICHHTSKPPAASSNSFAGNVYSGRGATTIAWSTRIVYTLSSPTDADVLQYGLTPDDRRRLVRFEDAEKMNYSLSGDDAVWLEKLTIILPNGDEVGALTAASMDNRVEKMRQYVAECLKAELLERGSGSMSLTDAATTMQMTDALWETSMSPQLARNRIERLFMRTVVLQDGIVLKAKVENGKKVIAVV